MRKDKKTIFIISEVGVNHNGSFLIAKRLIDAAANAGADAVKFQTFTAEALVCKNTPKAIYQSKTTKNNESQLEMLRSLQLDITVHRKLIAYCRRKGIIFLSSAFDLESVDLLRRLGLKIFKIPSGEITNLPYLRKIGRLNKKIIISTGMANLKEIKEALDTLISCGTRKDNITVLHCNSEYPTPIEDVNLKAMLSIKDKFKVRIGYSDHTLGIEVPIAAVALGASVIEKHLTLDKNMQGSDHKASLNPQEFAATVKAIRNTEMALGSGIKGPSKSERKNIGLVRKSIVAARLIKKGEMLTPENITTKRPGTGISPMKWNGVVGNTSKRTFQKDELIEV